MCEVERHVLRVGLACFDDLPELFEKRARRSLGLHEPTHVVLHVALRKLHAVPGFLGQAGVGGQGVRMVLEDVPERDVVVSDRLARLVAAELPPAGDGRAQRLHLHDVMNGGQHEHRQHSLLVMHEVALRVLLVQEKAGGFEHVVEEAPINLRQEVCPFRELLLATLRRSGGLGQRLPIVPNAEAERLSAIGVQAHQPIHREQGADSSLVLIVRRPAARGRRRRAVFAGDTHVEGQLGKTRLAILEEHLARVVLVADPASGIPGPSEVAGLAGHQVLDERRGHASEGERGHAPPRGRRHGRRRRDSALGVQLVRVLDLAVVEKAAPEDQPRAEDVLARLPSEGRARVGVVFPSDVLKVVPVREAELGARGLRPAGDLVDSINRLEAREGPRVLNFLAEPVRALVDLDRLADGLRVHPQALAQGLRQRSVPPL
mmetsp:Transcript_39120/g.112463  ORF Transcript_39120/g.112463 Transcript_39120/m.112463 type:complete len:432 (+) Transcript_39120:964-2259(+)